MCTLKKTLSIYNNKILYKLYKKKAKYVDYKDLLSQYIDNNQYFYFINKYFTNLLF